MIIEKYMHETTNDFTSAIYMHFAFMHKVFIVHQAARRRKGFSNL